MTSCLAWVWLCSGGIRGILLFPRVSVLLVPPVSLGHAVTQGTGKEEKATWAGDVSEMNSVGSEFFLISWDLPQFPILDLLLSLPFLNSPV